MTTLTVTLAGICSGGNHLTFTVSGDASASKVVELGDLATPPSAEDVDALIRIVARMAKNGRTVAAAKTLLQAGVTVTI